MRILLFGGLGEVGRSVGAALRERGHEITSVTSRRDAAGDGVVHVSDTAGVGSVDLIVNAAGPGDHRVGRDWLPLSRTIADTVAPWDVPKLLFSTLRVMEGATQDYGEGDAAVPTTPYAAANAEHEVLWRERAGDGAAVLRLANIFAIPASAGSPQERLLPWSLATEALDRGAITVRSGRQLTKSFVDADDIAAAVEWCALGSPTVVATTPGAPLSLGALVAAVQGAFDAEGLGRPEADFGPDGAPSPGCRPGWLAERGWRPGLTPARIQDDIAAWLRQRPSIAS